jgi:SNF2 family DNA or RNA helicase
MRLFCVGLDGGTSSLEREKLINAFNAPNSNAKLFLLSTR